MPSSAIANATPKTHSEHKIAAVTKNVLIPLTPSLVDGDDTASEGRDGIGEVLWACIHREDRLEAAVSIEASEPEANAKLALRRGNLVSLRFCFPVIDEGPCRRPRVPNMGGSCNKCGLENPKPGLPCRANCPYRSRAPSLAWLDRY